MVPPPRSAGMGILVLVAREADGALGGTGGAAFAASMSVATKKALKPPSSTSPVPSPKPPLWFDLAITEAKTFAPESADSELTSHGSALRALMEPAAALSPSP